MVRGLVGLIIVLTVALGLTLLRPRPGRYVPIPTQGPTLLMLDTGTGHVCVVGQPAGCR